MKIASIILFAITLTGLIYFTSSQLNPDQYRKFVHFLYRLERIINATSCDILPFKLTVGLIENLRQTSDEFKNLCVGYDAEEIEGDHELLSPLTALNRTIHYVFYYYKQSARNYSKTVIEDIQQVDPIGFNVYLTKENVRTSSPTFMDFVIKFLKTMNDRIRLFKMKTDDWQFSIIGLEDYRNLKKLPMDIRKRIATEYVDTPLDPVNMFTDLVTEITSKKMYRIATDLNAYQTHSPSTSDDVQLLYGTYFHNANYWAGIHVTHHAVCIFYKAYSQTIHVYDSLMDYRLDDRQLDIISKLYPYNLGTIFERPIALQDKHPTCAIFAMEYATMLILGQDPAIYPIKLNKVHGDETLYMRMHILNMLAKRKLSSLST